MTRLRVTAALAAACAAGFLGAGHATTGGWAWAAVAAAAALAGLLAQLLPGVAAPAGYLAVSAALAVAGILAGAPGWLMGLGLAASLIAWDLALLIRERVREGATEEAGPPLRLRLAALVAGLTPGLALAALLRGVRLELPLLPMMAAVALLLFALQRLARWGG